MCAQIARILKSPRIEMDSLYHGPNWTPRETFVADVNDFLAGPQWVTELQYRQVRPMIVQRADTLVWLDYPAAICMRRLISRTVRRRLGRVELWNGNYEHPFTTFFTDRDYIVRWAWRTRNSLKAVIPTLEERFAPLHVVRLTHPREATQWLNALSNA